MKTIIFILLTLMLGACAPEEEEKMSYSPIAFAAPNYRDYSGYWLKAYEPGTTTPKYMSNDREGTTLSLKYEVNKDGFFVSDGSVILTPYINGSFDLWLFPTETDANNNDTTNAIRIADGLGVFYGLELAPKSYKTILEATADNTLEIDDTVFIQETGDSYVVSSSGDIPLSNGLYMTRLPNSSEYNETPTDVLNPITKNPEKALFAFHFDGPYATNFTTLLDKADELGVKVGIGSINDLTNGAFGGKVGDPNFGDVAGIIDAHNRGHEIYNHGFSSALNLSPGTNVSEDLQDFWINSSHEWLQTLGINAQIWVTSNGGGISDQTPHLDPKYIPKILERHSVALGRTSSITNDVNGFEGVSYGKDTPINQVGLTRANIEGQTLANIEAFIDYCIQNKRVAVFHAHDSGNSGQVDVLKFEQIVNLIHSKGYEVVKSQEVFASFSNLFSDDATTSKAANNTALSIKQAVQENLLPTTNLKGWTEEKQAGIGTAVLTNYGSDRSNGEQFQLVVTDPTVTNSLYKLVRTIDRPFNKNDVATLCFGIEAQTTDTDAFGLNCIVQFYTGLNGTGSVVATYNKGKIVNSSILSDVNYAVGVNGFVYSTAQSVKLTYEIANKTTWSGSKSLNLFNPILNRGNKPSVFFKTGADSGKTLWKGNAGSVGSIELDSSAYGYQFVKVEVGVNNSIHDVRGSELFMYNTHDNRTIRAWTSSGTSYTDFVVRFNSPTELEVISENVTGGGDFAVLGVYGYKF